MTLVLFFTWICYFESRIKYITSNLKLTTVSVQLPCLLNTRVVCPIHKTNLARVKLAAIACTFYESKYLIWIIIIDGIRNIWQISSYSYQNKKFIHSYFHMMNSSGFIIFKVFCSEELKYGYENKSQYTLDQKDTEILINVDKN